MSNTEHTQAVGTRFIFTARPERIPALAPTSARTLADRIGTADQLDPERSWRDNLSTDWRD